MADQHRLRQILAGAFATLISLKLLLREVFFGIPLLQRRSCTIHRLRTIRNRASGIGGLARWQELTPIRNYQPPRRQERQDRISSLGETNQASEGPTKAFSRSWIGRSKHRIFGDLGVMAVQGFSRIRADCLAITIRHRTL